MSTHLPLENRIALITGASRGIGAAVARHYASLGAHVILVARTVGGLEAVDDLIQKDGKGSATLVPCDLNKLQMIDQMVTMIAERFGKLDILIGNAATIGNMAAIDSCDNKEWDKTLSLNLTVNFRLLRAIHPLLLQSDAGRAIFVTAGTNTGDLTDVQPFWGAYAASKAGLESLVKTYAKENASTSIRTNLIHPGVVGTALRKQAFPGEEMKDHPTPDSITHLFEELALPSCTKNGEIITGSSS